MNENPSPGLRKEHVFSHQRPVAALLVMAAVLSFALLFASVGQTDAASSATASTYTHLVVSLLQPGNLTNRPINTPMNLEAILTTYGPNETIAKVEFYSSTGGSTSTLIATSLVASSSNPTYSSTWTPSVPGTYSLTAKAYDTIGNVATSTPVTVNVVVGTPIQTPSPDLVVMIPSPSNGVYTLPAQIPFTAGIYNVDGSVPLGFTIVYYATLEPNGPTVVVGEVTENSPRIFTVPWVPQQAGFYDLVVKAQFIDDAGLQQGTSPTVTVQINAPQTSPTSTGGSCSVRYQLESQWSGGFTTNVVLTNTGSVPMNGWTLAFPFPGDQKITELWNGSYTQTGEQVTIANLSYNGSIVPGGTVNLGFNGIWTNNDTNPTRFTLNGMTCST